MNETMATLYDALVENATLAQQWQIEAQSAAADLRNANLDDSSLYGVNLYGADLRHAHLNNANLRYAILVNADMRNAGLFGADLVALNSTEPRLVVSRRPVVAVAPFRCLVIFDVLKVVRTMGTRWLP